MAAVGSAIKTQAGRGKASYPIACALSMFACAVLLTTVSASGGTITSTGSAAVAGVVGICPPYKLRDEHGNIIDPVHGVNTNAPYSSRQTCGAAGCHDYNKITEGFHFQQGKGEAVPAWMAERYQWVTSPGNYGGTWCSPAPLYRYLAPKSNASPVTIDMTSFTFITAGCAQCHPGGGPLEFDRNSKRRHQQMVIGLMCNRNGCPVGVEVFAGNTQDATTVEGKIAEVQTQYGLKEIIFVADRGLVTQANDQQLAGVHGLHVISALSHPQMLELLQRGVIQPELFDQTQIVEVLDPARPQRRYFLCRNPHTAQHQAKTREALLGRTIEALNRIASA